MKFFAVEKIAFELCAYLRSEIEVADFLIGVVSAIIIWGFLYRFFDKPVPVQEQLAIQN